MSYATWTVNRDYLIVQLGFIIAKRDWSLSAIEEKSIDVLPSKNRRCVNTLHMVSKFKLC